MTSEGAPELNDFTQDFCASLARVDSTEPEWAPYRAGIGPHPETEALKLIAHDLSASNQARYGSLQLGAPYPGLSRQRCDLVIGAPPCWAIEVKMLRLFGDNGKLNDNMLMHILSPYPAHRSALTDVSKLSRSAFPCRLGVLIYGFDYDNWPMDPAIEAFERLAGEIAPLLGSCQARFGGLVHPVHQQGRVYTWEIGKWVDVAKAPRSGHGEDPAEIDAQEVGIRN